jgi:hypothetical protein
MPAVELVVTDRHHDARRLSGFQDDDDLIRLGCLEVRVDQLVAPALWRLEKRGVPLVGLILHPALKLLGGTAPDIAADRIEVPIGGEKAYDPLGLLKQLDEPVQQNAVKTPTTEANAVSVMVVEGLRGRLPLIRSRQHSRRHVILRAPNGRDIKGKALG